MRVVITPCRELPESREHPGERGVLVRSYVHIDGGGGFDPLSRHQLVVVYSRRMARASMIRG